MTATLTTPPAPRALYAHVPFCHTICGYCDFYSVVFDRGSIAPLVDALLAELRRCAASMPLRAECVFVGGGTPTTLPPAQLAALLCALRRCADPAGLQEFTVEANPATVSPAVAAALAECGVTRVSIGAQSFDPAELRVLERIHEPPQVRETVETCRRAGIAQVNLDLIFGVPGQSLAGWLANLRRAIDLDPDHLSCYGLTYEPGTPLFDQLHAGAIRRIDDALEAEMFDATIDTLAGAGFRQYEISNFARPGRECRHNLVYWHNQPYLGIGPSAAGYVDRVRYKNVPDIAQYVRAIADGRSPRIHQERRTLDQEARETAMLELRLRDGMRRSDFQLRFGHDPAEFFRDALDRHAPAGLVAVRDDSISLTRAGQLVADTVIADFVCGAS